MRCLLNSAHSSSDVTTRHDTHTRKPSERPRRDCASCRRICGSCSPGWPKWRLPEIAVTDLCMDSREASPGCLFLAVPGIHGHGLAYLDQAAAAGTNVILWEPAPDVQAPAARADLLLIAVPGLRQVIGRIADRFFDAAFSEGCRLRASPAPMARPRLPI